MRLTWDNESKNWLLTAFEKKNSAFDNTTDTGETLKEGKQNDTATLQNTVSESKDTTTEPKKQEVAQENLQPTPQSTAEEQMEVSPVENKDADEQINNYGRLFRVGRNRIAEVENYFKLGLISPHFAISGTMFKVTNSSRILHK